MFGLYQLSIVIGIALLPIALVARRAGIPIPVGRLVDRIETAYRQAAEQ
jgi:hypothetical protein